MPSRLPAVFAVAILGPAVGVAAAAGATPATAAALWPVPGPVVAEFDPPDPDWLPGHRGIDLAADVGDPIRTPRHGIVQFAGSVAGTEVVVIGHGAVSATYLPAVTSSQVGDPVAAGTVIAELGTGSHCPQSCLHWGARANGRYVDPRILLGDYEVVLTPVTD